MALDCQVFHRMLRHVFVVLALIAVCCAEPQYYAVCDAGSTGTRLYIFSVDLDAAKAKSVFVKKTKPGLSSYAENPASAVPPLLQLLKEGASKLPEGVASKTPLSIFGTAGMRLLEKDTQDKVWMAVKSGLTGSDDFPFEKESLEARTAHGSEEGLWAVVTTNFLTGRIGHDLKSLGTGSPFGLMDLGGSSTQIAIPPVSAAEKGNSVTGDHIVHSYLGFGMTYIREQVRKQTSGSKDAGCYMKGASVDGLVGSGEASVCRDLIRQMMSEKSKTCQADSEAEKPCLGDLDNIPNAKEAVQGGVQFYAVAGLTYVVDFVDWWLKLNPSAAAKAESFIKGYPNPTIGELETAVDAMCAGDYELVATRTADKKLAHPFTGADNAPFRCFQANYILVLLNDMYGFPNNGRSITYALDIDGEDLEWPLGSLLHNHARKSQNQQQAAANEL
eukprot:gb/GFBE01019623.1/.p1 GENE.gb/GFBE01019623.1/~~gb/GFBE01019623.1/.p1  ORF type:complete len:445 (+),score=127.24 gb/GFBE01019623.1/:1-1335(+)